jgi:hypothetical protein
MDYQNYAPGYAAHLPDTAQVVVEMGIFKGTGLALWKDLYPDAEVIGLDLDLDRYHDHTEELIKLGAFKTGLPEVYEFDEFEDDSWDMLAEVLPAGCVDVWVDDACHDARAIIQAFRRAKPFMAPGGVYIMEDNADVYDRLREEGDIGGSIHQYAQRLTIVCLNG